MIEQSKDFDRMVKSGKWKPVKDKSGKTIGVKPK